MNIYISLDMEGLAGITSFQQEKNEQARFRQALHDQVSWIVEGIQASSRNKEVKEILIADSHNQGMNLCYDTVSRLDDRISLVSGAPRPVCMMAGCRKDTSVVFLAGYHAGAGVWPANMDHTFSSAAIYSIHINGMVMNEATVNAATVGNLNVPVGLIIGDSGLQKQLTEEGMLPWVTYVCTKEALGRFSAKFRPQKQVKEDTAAAVCRTLAGDPGAIPRYVIEAPYRLDIEFVQSSMAEAAAGIPGVTRLNGFTVEAILDKWEDVYGMIMSSITAARSV